MSMFTVIKEQIQSFYLIRRLSLFEMKSKNNNNYLGILWELLNPLIQLFIYWFVFGFGIRSNKSVDGVPFALWLITGMIVWFFVNPSILESTRSIYSRLNFIAKMNFPMSVIPSYVIISKFYPHLMLTGVVMVILEFTKFKLSIYVLQLPYFMFAAIALLIAIGLITSTLATIVRDVNMIVTSIMRVLVYLTPLLWTPNHLPQLIQLLMKLNPLYYIVEGYRAALLGGSWYFMNWHYSLYFWCVVFGLLWIGAFLHLRFRAHFVDYL